MSNTIIDRSSVLLGMGDVFVLDAVSGNYSSSTAVSTKSDLLGRMENVRIYSKRELKKTKKLVNGLVHDDNVFIEGVEFYLEFNIYEHNAKTQAALFGGGLTETAVALGAIMATPKKLRFEVRFTYPIGNAYMWYIFPKCVATSELDFSPGNSQGFTNKGVFTALPAVDENGIWYDTTTHCFNNYIV